MFASGGEIDNKLELPYRKSGCAALDMAYVAAGRYDGYFQSDLNIWDIAAGIILVKEAGELLIKLIFRVIKKSKLLPQAVILIQNYLKN